MRAKRTMRVGGDSVTIATRIDVHPYPEMVAIRFPDVPGGVEITIDHADIEGLLASMAEAKAKKEVA